MFFNFDQLKLKESVSRIQKKSELANTYTKHVFPRTFRVRDSDCVLSACVWVFCVGPEFIVGRPGLV